MFNKKPEIINDADKIEELLTRGVDRVVDQESLKKKLNSGKKLRIKLGIDPTSPNIHIGRAIPLMKLKDFQDLGHQIVFIIGDFTGVIGDTSDKESERPMLTNDEVNENMRKYVEQAGKILDISKCEIYHNSKWLGKLKYQELSKQANEFSLSDFISRDNIKKRLDEGKRVSLRELLYPLMQGYDSVEVKADVELGGTDQWFNLLAGRTLQKAYNQEPQDILTTELIEGLDGRKMSSSWGNTINLFDEPNDMFGKVMSLRDELVIRYFELTTRVENEEILKLKEEINSNPKGVKVRLAKEIVTMYHSKEDAELAERNFEETFKKGGIPEDALEVKVSEGLLLIDILIENKLVPSKSEWRRLVEGGSITNLTKDEKINDPNYLVTEDLNLKIGKKKFIKVRV